MERGTEEEFWYELEESPKAFKDIDRSPFYCIEDSLFKSSGSNKTGRHLKQNQSVNALLETIESIKDCFPYDYCELSVQRNPETKISGELEKNFWYDGTNSVDSGYKSSCPTPDASEGTYYCHGINVKFSDVKNICKDEHKIPSSKPRIPMGTKIMNKLMESSKSTPSNVKNNNVQSFHRRTSCKFDAATAKSCHSELPGCKQRRPRLPSPRMPRNITKIQNGRARSSSPVDRNGPCQTSYLTEKHSCDCCKLHTECKLRQSVTCRIPSPCEQISHSRTLSETSFNSAGTERFKLGCRKSSSEMLCGRPHASHKLTQDNPFTSLSSTDLVSDSLAENKVSANVHEFRIKHATSCLSCSNEEFVGPNYLEDLNITEDHSITEGGDDSIEEKTLQNKQFISEKKISEPEYHVYEEIVYSDMHPTNKFEPYPPPLPARPDHLSFNYKNRLKLISNNLHRILSHWKEYCSEGQSVSEQASTQSLNSLPNNKLSNRKLQDCIANLSNKKIAGMKQHYDCDEKKWEIDSSSRMVEEDEYGFKIQPHSQP